ncbi:ArnT family glycosyltransferase [uncultured Bradyrhizobium sp.]|uniref:ArnT family glycosyltransferase n=1 Tax=uncultured Bradyrhizobium sp. TaxID=199684 RepID=UPI0035CBB6CA
MPQVICIAVACLFFWVGIQWIWEHRVGGLLDMDEAGYFGIAVGDYFELTKNGFLAWLKQVTGPNIQAPLTTALTSLVYAAAGLELHYGYLVPLASATIAILAAYWLACEIAGPYAGLGAAALTATTPLIVIYSRSFHFAMPATALVALALLAAVKSDRFSKTGWSIAFGIFLGLLPLARTMTIAFIPGILFGAALNIASSASLSGRLIRFVGALGVAAIVSAMWLAFTWKEVGSYLFSFGYGTRAAEYGTVIPFFSLDTLQRAILLVACSVFLPHLILIALGLAVMPAVAFHAIRQHGWKSGTYVANSPLLLLTVTVFCGIAALVSSPNTGSAFIAPLLPPLVVLAVCLAWQASTLRLYRAAVLFVIVSTAIVVGLPFLNIYTLPQGATGVPYLGPVGVSDNRGTIDIYIDSSGPRAMGRNKADAALWLAVFAETNHAISENGESGGVAVGFRNGIYSVNALGLQYFLKTRAGRSFILVDPGGTGNTTGGFREWLTNGAAAHSNLLLTSPGEEGEDFGPPVDYAALEVAARDVDFLPVDTWTLPNGRVVTLWKRPKR